MGELTPVAPKTAREFVAGRHATGSCQSGVLRHGWAIDGQLVGVSVLNNGTRAMQSAVFGAEYASHVRHHHRLAVDDAAPKFTASQFIGAVLRDLRANHPDVWAVVTYADLCYHTGALYRATNAVECGVVAKGNLKFLDPATGQVHTTQGLAPLPWPQRRAVAAERGWVEVRCKGKARFVWLLGTAKQRRSRPPMLLRTG